MLLKALKLSFKTLFGVQTSFQSLVKLEKNTVSKFISRNGTVFYLKICMMTLLGLCIKVSPCSNILFIADIVINNIERLASCYFYRNDETNIAMRKRVDLSH